MKLDALSNEDLISIIREHIPDLQEEKLVHQILKNKSDALYEEYLRAGERQKKAEAWYKAFLEKYEYQERTPGKKEYFIPRADLKRHEAEIKELNEARAGWWAAEEAHWEAYQKTSDAWNDVFVPEFKNTLANLEELFAKSVKE